ncbi:hypothetical protein [Catenuloplanes indicus]|uniref:Uncharacterized protein n=1 Tax=Catenuloplanes indicus TaxID=137267 RepID=A0AAE3W5Q8_9ACTN|nr:hypothetical protein [Catenuloplanes indicus]MDQ0369956.1 hypothetical protein [Catenuloplanes indicus]
MTTDPQYTAAGLAAARAAADREALDDTPDGGEIVGADDARADAIRAGADDTLRGATRDTDPTPVGRADAAADRDRAAG